MNLHGPVRAGQQAGAGTAEVTLSFPAWTDGVVAPSQHRLRVVPAPPGVKPAPVSPRLIKTLAHPDRTANLSQVRFLDQGAKLFAAGYPSGVVHIFDAKTWKEVTRIETPAGYRSSADYAIVTPDLRTLYVPVHRQGLVAGPDKSKRLVKHRGEVLAWDLSTGKPIAPLPTSASDRGVLRVELSPEAARLVTVERFRDAANGVADETRLWDLRSRTSVSLGQAHGTAAFAPDGRRLALALFSTPKTASQLPIIDVASRKPVVVIDAPQGGGFLDPLYAPDGKTLAVQLRPAKNEAATFRLYAADSGDELGVLKSGGNAPFAPPVFAPDGNHLAAADYGGGVTVWHVPSQQRLAEIAVPKGLRAGPRVAFSPDSKRFVLLAAPPPPFSLRDPDPADLPQARAYLFDLSRPAHPEILVLPTGYYGGVDFSPDGKTLAVGGAGGVHLFDITAAPPEPNDAPKGDPRGQVQHDFIEHLRDINFGEPVGALAFAPDGKTVAGGGNREVRIFDVQTGAAVRVLKGHEDRVTALAFAPDGRTLASGSHDKTVRLWETAGGSSQVLRGGDQGRNHVHLLDRPIACIRFDASGKRLLSCGTNNYVTFWDLASGSWELKAWTNHVGRGYESGCNYLAISPDGRYCAVAGVVQKQRHARQISLYRVDHGLQLLWNRGHDDELPATHVTFTPDNKKVISCGQDNAVRIWDVDTGSLRQTFRGPEHNKTMQAALPVADGRVLGVTRGGIMCLWTCADEKPSATLRVADKSVLGMALAPDGITLATGGEDGLIRLWRLASTPGEHRR